MADVGNDCDLGDMSMEDLAIQLLNTGDQMLDSFNATVPVQEGAMHGLPMPPLPNVPNVQLHLTSTEHAMDFVADPANAGAPTKLKKKRPAEEVLCPFCGSTTTGQGGATRFKSYTFLCDSPTCNQMFNRSIFPNAKGEYEITRSSRALQNQPKRSGDYACGKCGFKPKKGHICPFGKNQVGHPLSNAQGNRLAAATQLLSSAQDHRLATPIAATGCYPAAQGSVPIVVEPLEASFVGPLVASSTTTGAAAVASQGANATDFSLVKSLETPGLNGLMSGKDVHNALKLERLHVRGDGSCWVYAILAPIGLCQHADKDKTKDPTPRDRFMDKECREWCFQYLTLHAAALGLPPEEVANVPLVRKAPTYPLATEADYGEFGTIHTITALAAFFKVSCVVWNTTTIDDAHADQQVIKFLPNNDEPKVEEHAMSPNDILRFSLANSVVHIEWNGIDHYSALVTQWTVSVDRHAHDHIINSAYEKMAHAKVSQKKRKAPAKAHPATPVEPSTQAEATHCKIPRVAHAESTHEPAVGRTRAKKPSTAPKDRQVLEQAGACLSGWTAIRNKICPSYEDFCRAENLNLSELAFQALGQGYNAIFTYESCASSGSLIVYLKYAFAVQEEHCLELGDATGTLYLHNASHFRLTKTPPLDIKGCLCNKHYIDDASDGLSKLQCKHCHGWYHKKCVGLTDKEFTRLTANDDYTCPTCKSTSHE